MYPIEIENKSKKFNKVLSIEGDKSLSIRWALIASQSKSKSKSFNLLLSEDVINTLKCLRTLGVKIKVSQIFVKLMVLVWMDLNTKNLILDAGNSGTLGRLIMGLLIHSKNVIKLRWSKFIKKRFFKSY